MRGDGTDRATSCCTVRSNDVMRCCLGLSLCAVLGASGCDSDECGDELDIDGGRDGAAGDAIGVEVGLAAGLGGIEFVPLEEGGDIPLETFGQGGTHATVAVRARGLGTNVAFVDVTVENAETRAVVMTVPSSRPQLWICDEAREVCDQLPVHVMTGGLAAPGIENRDGLEVLVHAQVRDERGRRGSGSAQGVLRWMGPPPRDAGARDAGGADDDAGDDDGGI
jgi:hypothetical protein